MVKCNNRIYKVKDDDRNVSELWIFVEFVASAMLLAMAVDLLINPSTLTQYVITIAGSIILAAIWTFGKW